MDQKLNTSWVENNTAEQHGEPHWIYICWESGPHNWLGASVWCCCPEVELHHISTEKCQISKFKAWFLLSVCQFFLVMSQIEQNFLYMPGKDSTELHPQPIFILLPLYSPRQGFSVQLWLFWNTICGQGWPQNHTQIKKKRFIYQHVCLLACVCVYTVLLEARRGYWVLSNWMQTAVSFDVAARNQIQFLCEGSQCSQILTHPLALSILS